MPIKLKMIMLFINASDFKEIDFIYNIPYIYVIMKEVSAHLFYWTDKNKGAAPDTNSCARL